MCTILTYFSVFGNTHGAGLKKQEIQKGPSAEADGPFLRKDFLSVAADSHAVKGTPHKNYGDQKEYRRQCPADLRIQCYGKLHGEKPEKRGELDNGIHGNRRCILKRIPYSIPHYGRGMKFGALHVSSVSTSFLALSHAPPAFAIKMAW